MGDDGDAARRENLISAGMIQVVMAVDGVLDRLRSLLPDLRNQFFDRRRRKESVEDQHAIITDYKSCVTRSQTAGLGDRRVNSICDFD